ncbi:hypothetical protein [Streptomyces sp. SAS_272]|uniref:hypothetical protein n=1 Tax=Streptomyces sp. SAS_272 TaxID=3412747 RepID=UPI00403D0D8E
MTRTPNQTFWSDQALATARDVAADGRTVAVVNDFPNGEQCSWCDCTLADFKDHRCGGCPKPAGSILRIHDGTPVRRDIPVCEGHLDDAIELVARFHGGTG